MEYILAVILGLFSMPCSHTTSGPPQSKASQADTFLSFRIRQSPKQRAAQQTWICTYSQGKKSEEFELSLNQSEKPGQLLDSSAGEIRPHGSSKCRLMLKALASVLEADHKLWKPKHEASLKFATSSLGDNQSRSADDSFQESPAGDWTIFKCFVGDNDEGEFFLNLDLKSGRAEISLKDPDFANYLMNKFWAVLG